MSLFHASTPLLINLRTTLYYRLPTPDPPPLATYDTASLRLDDGTTLYSHPLSPITFATHVLLPDTSSISYPPSSTDILTGRPSQSTSPNSPLATAPVSSPPVEIATSTSTSPPTSTPPDFFLRSIDNACLVRIRDMVHYTPYHFNREIDYHAERGFIWDGVAMTTTTSSSTSDNTLDATSTTKSSTPTATTHSHTPATDGRYLSMTGLTSNELVQQVDMIRARGHRDWVRVDMRVEIEPSPELRERTEVLARFFGEGGNTEEDSECSEYSEDSEGGDGSDGLEERGSEFEGGPESELEREGESEVGSELEMESETEDGEVGFGAVQEGQDGYETEIEEDMMDDAGEDTERMEDEE
ncbi:uncharacterized protein C8A04DRAFT_29161 [Dichotomopilus funicola]|uniref:Uncharacterized protein n=1 Tax=Dichotomopilus funicola TaxID=1934379 RepID=A0AAN6V1R3_9PEZI|nr:hypothetical protein C8A04DRAFT_29161 [Dichotomopilus funicola]